MGGTAGPAYTSPSPQGWVSDHTHGQHGRPPHPRAHGSVWIGPLPCEGSLLQDANTVTFYLHECFHW